jgi:hypothetical protein
VWCYDSNMNIELADELIKMARVDQEYRHQWFDGRDDPAYIQGMERMDDMHAVRLEEVISDVWVAEQKACRG